MTAFVSIVVAIALLYGALIIWFNERPPVEPALAASNEPLPAALLDALKDVTHPRWHDKITANARLLQDLRILGDDVDDLSIQLGHGNKLDMSGFNFNDYFPGEASWHSFLVTVLSPLGRDYGITKKYREFPVRDLVALKTGKSWRDLHLDETAT